MIEYGLIHDVRAHNAGSFATVDAVVDAAAVTVEDAVDFTEDGGTLAVTSLDTDGVTMVTTSYDYSTVDFETNTITLATGLVTAAADGDRVDVWPLQPEKQAVVVLSDTEDAITAIVPHALVDLVATGIREEDARELVRVELVGQQWVLADVLGEQPAIQSADFEEASQGWLMGAESTQFDNANVIGTLGADTVSAETITLGAADLGESLDLLPLGLIAQSVVGSAAADTASVSANTMMFIFTAADLKADRMYRITYSAPLQGTVNNDVFVSRVYYTTDGSVPGLSGVMPGSVVSTILSATGAVVEQHSYYYTPNTDVDVLKLGYAIQRQSGSGTCKVVATNPNQPFYFTVEDCGAAASITGEIAQKSKSSGTVDPDPKATYTKLFYANQSRSYDSDNGLRSGDPTTNDCYQGYYSGVHGTTKSVVCFDDSAIRSALSGATINSVRLTFRVKHSYYNSGLNVHIRDHNVSSPPTTYPGGSEIAHRNGCVEGSSYTVTLPVSFGNALKNGTARGVGFFAPSTDRIYYGYMYGADAGATRPRISVTYTK